MRGPAILRPLLLLAAALLPAGVPAGAGVEGKEVAVKVEGADKLEIEGVLVRPLDFGEHRKAPAVLLLHSVGRTRDDLDDLVNALNARGILALAADLRGHGQSRQTTDAKMIGFPYLSAADFRKMVDDQRLLIDWLAARPEVDASRLAIVGVGVGSLVGARAAGEDDRVRALGMVGPMDRFMGLSGEKALEAVGPRPVWLGTSSTNSKWMSIARLLAGVGDGERTVRGYDAAVSITSELLWLPELRDDLVSWLAAKLLPAP